MNDNNNNNSNSTPLPSYKERMAFLLAINKECNVLQDHVVESSPEEHKVANDGKYLTAYGFGTIGHRSERNSH
jgi:hypothetical protein